MPEFLIGLSNYYFIILILQGYCVYHSYKRGIHSKWIYIILFLPLAGSLIYIFSEVVKKNKVNELKNNMGNTIFPTARIKELEKKYNFSNNFKNKINLAYAYQAANMHNDAIPLLESALVGIHADDEELIFALIDSYYVNEEYEKLVNMAEKVEKSIGFNKKDACIYYVISLEKIGQIVRAVKLYKDLDRNLDNYQARYFYGLLLIKQGKVQEAKDIYEKVLDERQYLSKNEIKLQKFWLNKVGEEYKKI